MLGFGENLEKVEPKVETTNKQRYRPLAPKKERQVYRVNERVEEDDDPYGLRSAKAADTSVPNFKKRQPLC